MKRIPTYSQDMTAAILLFMFILLSALRLVATNWAKGLESIFFLALTGLTIGYALGISQFRPIKAFLLAAGYSLVLYPWILGVSLYENIPWSERLLSMLGRLGTSLNIFMQKKPVEDTFLFIILAGLVFWIISLLAGYQWSRHENLLAVLGPTWAILIFIQVYDSIQNDRIIYLILCIFISLLLVGRRFILTKRKYWYEHQIHFSGESSQEMNLTLITLIAAIILLAWIIPVPRQPQVFNDDHWKHLLEPWQSIRKDLSNAVAGLEGKTAGTSYDFYSSDKLELGQKAISGDAVIFNVNMPTSDLSIPYYWRVRIFDRYENKQWSDSNHLLKVSLPDSPDFPLPFPDPSEPSEFTFTISRGQINFLFSPAGTVWISRPANIKYFQAGEGRMDPILFQADNPVRSGEQFQVRAIQSNPTILDLRQAGEDYPDWVIRHYLQVPENLSAKVRALADQLAEGKLTPFDKTLAITKYLRQEITYVREVSPPLLAPDILEWFLFDYKKGYCNYYATAEVIMLRALGIPARMVVGFAEGEIGPSGQSVRTVRLKDAHAWPEVFFPGIGWVEFEPTSSLPSITRPSGVIPTTIGQTPQRPGTLPDNFLEQTPGRSTVPSPVNGNPPPEQVITNDNSIPVFAILILGMVVICLSGFLVWRRQMRLRTIPTPLPVRLKNTLERASLQVPSWLQRWASQALEPSLQRSFNIIHHSLKWLGQPAQPADTPLAASQALIGLLPVASIEINILYNEYQKSMFSLQPGNEILAHNASRTIRHHLIHAVRIKWFQMMRARVRRFLKV